MQQALIIGISGQDGAYLAKLLLEKGYRVAGTSRNARSTSFANLAALGLRDRIELYGVTLTDPQGLRDLLSAVEPDEIYHLAGQSSVSLSFEQPAETFLSIAVGTLHLLEAIRSRGVSLRLFHASSGDCFGNTGAVPATEETPFSPRSPYGVAKAAAHWNVATYRDVYGLFACSGILFNHESPLRPPHFVTRKITSAACRIAAGSGERLRLGNLDVARDWGYAPDYVEAMWRLLQRKDPADCIIATGRTITLREFTAEAFAAVDLDWREHVDVDAALYRPADILISRADPTKAERLLSWRATLDSAGVARALVAQEQDRLRRERGAT
jgi:GDPmannose 4,6-dehydratase